MIKIMIVDDMPIFLEYLKNCIDWNQYGFDICCEAKDGREALQLFEQFYPDVVITDITMPYVDGLALSEQLMQQYSDVSIILITGNNEFEYARRAVKIGVCDYIVKPFEKEELILSLLKLQDNMNRAIELKSAEREEHRQREYELQKLILKSNHGATMLEFQSEFFLVCTMQFMVRQTGDYEKIMNWESILISMIRGMLELNGTSEIFRDFQNHIVILMNFTAEQDMKQYQLYELMDLSKIIKTQLGLETTIAVSDCCYGTMSIREGYYRTLQLLNEESGANYGAVRDDRKIEKKKNAAYVSWEAIGQLHKSMEQLNYELVCQTMQRELDRFLMTENPEQMKLFYTCFLSVLFTNIITNGRTMEDIFGEEFQPYQVIGEIRGTREESTRILEYYQKYINYEITSVHTNSKSYQIMEEAKQYVENHYAESSLSITEIAKALFINQTYLRKMFKSGMNMTLSEYITKYRMTKAKQLLQDTNDKLSLISEEVGYADVSYFSKCFKKYYGVSPKGLTR